MVRMKMGSFWELCNARDMIIENTWFNKRNIHNYTWVSGVSCHCALLNCVCVKQMKKEKVGLCEPLEMKPLIILLITIWLKQS